MAIRLNESQSEHDTVVRESAKTYSDMVSKGCKVAINPDGEKNQRVGPESNPRYPDIIVWRPENPYSSSGKAEVIEEVETADSVTEEEAKQWKDYGSLGIKFILTVPKGYAKEAARIVDAKSANVTEIWHYYSENGGIKFQKYR